jgi:hypothetical protein
METPALLGHLEKANLNHWPTDEVHELVILLQTIVGTFQILMD